MSNEFQNTLLVYCGLLFVVFLVLVAITRLIFSIPTFLRYQRAQIKLLEEIAKAQGVDAERVKTIVSQGIEWEPAQ